MVIGGYVWRQLWFYTEKTKKEWIWRKKEWGGDEEGRGHSVEYHANVPLVTFNSLHLRRLRQRCSSTQILFVLNLYTDQE